VISSQVGKKWVHARVNPSDRAQATQAALEALSKARVAHQVFHSSANAVPLAAERKDGTYKVLFLDVGLMGAQLGVRASDWVQPQDFARANEGAVAEQWIGQHLLDLRRIFQAPHLHYWVREKAGSSAEVDYVVEHGSRIIPVEVKAGASSRMKSLHVFLGEKPSAILGVHFSVQLMAWAPDRKVLRLPFYLVEQLERLVNLLA
jgi:predicted AAA+ superfamily ATPase